MRLLVALLALALPLVASAQKPPPPASRGAGQTQAPAAAGGTQVTWYGHAAFVIRTPGGATLALDPWFDNPKAPKDVKPPASVDAVLLSHGHPDHVGKTKDLIKGGKPLVAVFELANLLGSETGGNVGGTWKVKDATIHVVEAVHSSSYSGGGKGPAAYAGTPVGFVIEIQNGPTLYFAGDTARFAGMKMIGEQYKPKIALLPIGGHFTMDPADAARAAKDLGVSTVVPMHFGTFPVLTGTSEALSQALRAQGVTAEMKLLEPGKTVSF